MTKDKHSLPLSESMNQLKEEIHKQTKNEQMLLEQVHQGSNIASTISTGVSSFFSVISSILNANKSLPVVGFFLQMVSLIPKSISVLTDPKTSIPQKLFATGMLVTIGALSITAFTMGAMAAAIIGTVVSSMITVLEGVGLLGASINKYQTSNAYDKTNAFNEALELRQIPDGEEYDELLEIRAVELKHKLAQKHLSEDKENKLAEERDFIADVLQEKNITIGSDKEKPPALLQELYKKRDEKLAELVSTIATFNSNVTTDNQLEEIQTLQNDIVEIDNEIEKITPSIKKLAFDNSVSNEKVAFSVGTTSMATAGTLLSVIGIMLIAGSVAAPPFVLPALIGFGITLSAISFIKWGIENLSARQDAEFAEQKLEAQKESILDEALVGYEHQLNNKIAPKATPAQAPVSTEPSSHSTMHNAMKKALPISPSTHQSDPQVEPSIEKKPPVPLDQSQYKQQIKELRENALPTENAASNNFTPT
ncbi:T4SS effector SidA family protein [uncultured Legionella sp.]|uniref:T4SS effector SidA family protein n=1 Tax=uncultured Legionella sp. TaxID=210934 RepID=UPI00260FB28E|nr:T4SS effector SidA family protein [uncultured Legionella sp.]